MSSMAAAAARCRSLTARALARPALANHRGLSRPTLVANHRLLASATTTTTTTTAAASGLQLNIPSAVAELEIEHERYEKALAENDVDVLDLLFLKDESTLRFGADGAQFGYSAIAAMRANRRPPGPREILSTSITTFGHDYGVANREFRRGADPRIGRQSQTWVKTGDGWKVVSAHVSWQDETPATLLQLAGERGERLAKEAQEHAAGDAAIACSGDRSFPIKLSDTALYITDMQGDFLLPHGRIGQHYSDEDIAVMGPVMRSTERLVAAAREAGLTIAYGRSHRFGAEVRRDLICSRDSDDTYNVIESIRPRPEDIVVDKWTWGIFASTDLEEQLRARGIRRLLVCGVATNVCVTNMVFQAVDRFFRVCLVPEACGAFDRAWHDQAIGMLNGPQIKSGHSQTVDNTGLYFCETATVANVETTLRALREQA